MKNLKINELIENNNLWINEKLKKDKNYFSKLSKGQSPRYLMISCSDSRVPLNSLLKAEPGEIFIHRNIANQVNLTDINFLSVLEYSIEHLLIKHIIVVGHYSCGGIAAAVDGVDQGLVENWISPVNDLYNKNSEELSKISDNSAKMDRLSEINTIEQAKNILKTPVYQRALRNKKYPMIHAWIFDIYTGKIIKKDLNIEMLIDAGLLPEYYLTHIETNKTYYE
ncbi:MAG: carbonic anhydrase [Bacteroidales bacterium]|nr:carbonic anhydrase [Bacteroidales bacterium]